VQRWRTRLQHAFRDRSLSRYSLASVAEAQLSLGLRMPRAFRPWDVDQFWLLPPTVHELMPPGHLAHFICDTAGGALNLAAPRCL
jgi:hypothetical protein